MVVRTGAFPYIDLSRHMGVPYGEVLAVVSKLDREGHRAVLPPGVLSSSIYAAWVSEQQRRIRVLSELVREKGEVK